MSPLTARCVSIAFEPAAAQQVQDSQNTSNVFHVTECKWKGCCVGLCQEPLILQLNAKMNKE